MTDRKSELSESSQDEPNIGGTSNNDEKDDESKEVSVKCLHRNESDCVPQDKDDLLQSERYCYRKPYF